MDKQYLSDEFNRFFEFTTEDKSQVSSVSAKLFAEHIAYPLERELEKLKAQEPMCWMTPSGEGWMMRTEPPTIDTKLGWTALYEHPLPPDDVVQKYEELLYAVHRKFPDETRHQTALRYIKTAESPRYTNASVKEKA